MLWWHDMDPKTLNAAVAIGMGWKRVERDTGINYEMRALWDKPDGTTLAGDQWLPDFSGDPEAALTVVQAARADGWACQLVSSGQYWECSFSRAANSSTRVENLNIALMGERIETHRHTADTLPLAVAGAFVRMHGAWELLL